jgi:carboxyl-terminal processing protease
MTLSGKAYFLMNFMRPLFRISAVILLPLVTLVLGWQLGTRLEQKKFEMLTEHWDVLYSSESGSGQLIIDPEEEVDISLMWMVWRLLLKHYIEPDQMQVNPMLFGAIEGLVRGVGDQYTTFMTPNENTEFQQSLQGRLQGIGAELTLRDGMIVVVAPLKGSPAARAGLAPKDMIVEVDGEDVRGKNLNQVVHLIRGEKGTLVTLTVIRESESEALSISIRRDNIKVPSVEYELKETGSGSVGYIELNQFGEGSINEVEDAARNLQKENIEGLILDLRFNGGGFLDGSDELCSLFMKKGKVVTVERRNAEPVHHYVSGSPIAPNLPLVILINEGSASASEIVAGALQDHKRATVIGKQSFGKGTVQEVIDLPGGSSLRVTIAKWLTPDGRDIGKEGVTPDIEIEITAEDRENKYDPQMEAALQWLLGWETKE